MDFEKIIRQTQDTQLNSTWGGSVYALKDVLSYVDTNKDIAISSKVINCLMKQIWNCWHCRTRQITQSIWR